MKFEFKNDVETLCYELIGVGVLLLLSGLFGDFAIRLFNPLHPIKLGGYQIVSILVSGLTFWRAWHYLRFYK